MAAGPGCAAGTEWAGLVSFPAPAPAPEDTAPGSSVREGADEGAPPAEGFGGTTPASRSSKTGASSDAVEPSGAGIVEVSEGAGAAGGGADKEAAGRAGTGSGSPPFSNAAFEPRKKAVPSAAIITTTAASAWPPVNETW